MVGTSSWNNIELAEANVGVVPLRPQTAGWASTNWYPGSNAPVIAFACCTIHSRPSPRASTSMTSPSGSRGFPTDSNRRRAKWCERRPPELAGRQPSCRITTTEAVGSEAGADRASPLGCTHSHRHTVDGSKRALASPVVWGAGSERDFRQRLTLIVSFGALLRIVRLIVDKWGQPLLLNDSLYYSAQARTVGPRRVVPRGASSTSRGPSTGR